MAAVLLCAFLFSGCDILADLGLLPEDDSDNGGQDQGGDGGGDSPPSFVVSVQAPEKTATTTVLTLAFAPVIADINADDITVTSGDPGFENIKVEAVVPTGQPGVYSLALSGVTATGNITVDVHKEGYAISPASQTVPVYYVSPVVSMNFKSVDKSRVGETTTQLILAIAVITEDVTLGTDDITVAGGSTGAAAVTLIKAGEKYILGLDGVTASGTVTVGVKKNGYLFSPPSQDVQVEYSAAVTPVGSSIKEKFDVRDEGTKGVSATFALLHDFISSGGLTSKPDKINLGDWIDLEELTIQETGKEKFSVYNSEFKLTPPPPFEGYVGKSLRLIVVGINSFSVNDRIPPHVVFQFQNLPVTRSMNSTDTNDSGYAQSELRKYLVEVQNVGGYFLNGLYAAGVPKDDNILWAPTRYVAKGGSGATATDEITDRLWLPTAWEMFGTPAYSSPLETAQNQARLQYYRATDTADNNRYRVKYTSAGTAFSYWEGSPFSGNSTRFCNVSASGSAYADLATAELGIAPAFCIK